MSAASQKCPWQENAKRLIEVNVAISKLNAGITGKTLRPSGSFHQPKKNAPCGAFIFTGLSIYLPVFTAVQTRAPTLSTLEG